MEALGDKKVRSLGGGGRTSDGDDAVSRTLGVLSSRRYDHFSARQRDDFSHRGALATENITHQLVWHRESDGGVGDGQSGCLGGIAAGIASAHSARPAGLR